MYAEISQRKLQNYRDRTYKITDSERITDVEAAVHFVEQRGFVYFWPIKDILMPSLWVAVAGDRPVADQHDDPGHVTWGWKDSLLGKKRWYYAKVLRGKATLISLEVVPFFYALSENYGDPTEDHLILYQQGRLTQEAKAVYQALLDEGPLDTIALRRAAHLSSRENSARFERALVDLQSDFKILPVGVAQAGSWRYAFIYDLVTRHYPDIIDRTRYIDDESARLKLASLYFYSVGAAQLRDLLLLFRWEKPITETVLSILKQRGEIHDGVTMEGYRGEWMVLADLMKGLINP